MSAEICGGMLPVSWLLLRVLQISEARKTSKIPHITSYVRERCTKPTLNKREVRAHRPVSFTNVEMASGMVP